MPEKRGKRVEKPGERGRNTRENPASDGGDVLCFVRDGLGSFAKNKFLGEGGSAEVRRRGRGWLESGLRSWFVSSRFRLEHGVRAGCGERACKWLI